MKHQKTVNSLGNLANSLGVLTTDLLKTIAMTQFSLAENLSHTGQHAKDIRLQRINADEFGPWMKYAAGGVLVRAEGLIRTTLSTICELGYGVINSIANAGSNIWYSFKDPYNMSYERLKTNPHKLGLKHKFLRQKYNWIADKILGKEQDWVKFTQEDLVSQREAALREQEKNFQKAVKAFENEKAAIKDDDLKKEEVRSALNEKAGQLKARVEELEKQLAEALRQNAELEKTMKDANIVDKKGRKKQEKLKRDLEIKARGDEMIITKLTKGKSAPDITDDTCKQFTLETDILDPIYRLLFDNEKDYSVRYNNDEYTVSDEFKTKFKEIYPEKNKELSEDQIQGILSLCIKYKDKEKVAQDILTQAVEKLDDILLTKDIPSLKTQIEELKNTKKAEVSKKDIGKYTINRDNFVLVYTLLCKGNKYYEDETTKEIKKIMEDVARKHKNQGESYNERVNDLLNYCLSNNDKNLLARDVLLTIEKKPKLEKETTDSPKESTSQQKAAEYEQKIKEEKDKKKTKIGTTKNDPKEHFYLDIEKFKRIYSLLFGEEKKYCTLYNNKSFEKALSKKCSLKSGFFSKSTSILDNWKKENIMEILQVCLDYKDKSQAARDILLLADDDKRQKAKEYEQKIEGYIGTRTAKDIEVTKDNSDSFTILTENFERIYNLLFGDVQEYRTRYTKNINEGFKTELKKLCNSENNEALTEEKFQKILDLCLKNIDTEEVAKDILLLSVKKDSDEAKYEVSLRRQAKSDEQKIKKAREDIGIPKIGTKDNPKEHFYLDKYNFESVYNLLFGDGKKYSSLYDEIDDEFKNKLKETCTSEAHNIWGWTKADVMEILQLCLDYQNESQVAKDVLLLANNKREEAQGQEKQIGGYIGEKTKNDIKVERDNLTNFTIKEEKLRPIYYLLYYNEAEYSTKYNSTNSDLKGKLSNHINTICWGLIDDNNKDEHIKQILDLCLDYPDDPLAIDILLMAEEKNGSPDNKKSIIDSDINALNLCISELKAPRSLEINNENYPNFTLDPSSFMLIYEALKRDQTIYTNNSRANLVEALNNISKTLDLNDEEKYESAVNELLKLCLAIYDNGRQDISVYTIAENVLYLSEEKGNQKVRELENEVNTLTMGKSVLVNTSTINDYTFNEDTFDKIHELLYKRKWSEKYGKVSDDFVIKLNKIYFTYKGGHTIDFHKEILELCLQYPDDLAARDILLMAEKKEGEHTQGNVDDLKLSELDAKLSEIAQYVISRENVESSDICSKFDLSYDRCKIVMEQLKKVGIVGELIEIRSRGYISCNVLVKDKSSLDAILEKLSSKNEQEITRENAVKYYLPNFKIRRIIGTYVLSNSYPNDADENTINKDEKKYLEIAIKFLNGEDLDNDYTKLANLYKHLLLTKENITGEESLQDLSIGDLVILAENKKLNGLIDQLTDGKTQEINKENCGDFTIGRDEFKVIYTMYFAGQEYGNGESRYGEDAYGIYTTDNRIPSLMKNLYYAKIDGKTDAFELMAYNLLSALLEYGKDSQLAKDILLIAKRKDGGDSGSNPPQSINHTEENNGLKKYKINPDTVFTKNDASKMSLYKNMPEGVFEDVFPNALNNIISYLNGEIGSQELLRKFRVTEESLKNVEESKIKNAADQIAEQHKPFLMEIKQEKIKQDEPIEKEKTVEEAVEQIELDPLFEEIAHFVVQLESNGCSTSMLQRKRKLGYNRACKIIDQLEAAKIVGPFNRSKAREVLVKDEKELEKILQQLKNNSQQENNDISEEIERYSIKPGLFITRKIANTMIYGNDHYGEFATDEFINGVEQVNLKKVVDFLNGKHGNDEEMLHYDIEKYKKFLIDGNESSEE